jgi:hypothetical protein
MIKYIEYHLPLEASDVRSIIDEILRDHFNTAIFHRACIAQLYLIDVIIGISTARLSV